MGDPGAKSSWPAPPTTFPMLEASSVSQVSYYDSDGTHISSVSSSTLTTPTHSPRVSRELFDPTFKPALKSDGVNLQADAGPESEPESQQESGSESESESEFTYDYDASWYDSDVEFEYSLSADHDTKSMSSVSIPSEAPGSICGASNDSESRDDSFISFELAVRFNPNVEYIEAPEFAGDEVTGTEMTFHEIVELASRSSRRLREGRTSCPEDSNDVVTSKSDEYSPDTLELDKRLFIAYINGINGIIDPSYSSNLHTRVDEIKSGRVRTLFLDLDNAVAIYLDNILDHVVAVFRNLVSDAEFEELVTISGEISSQQQDQLSSNETGICDEALLEKIEKVLWERLGDGDIQIGSDELTFLAGGVIYMLTSARTPATLDG